MRIYADNAATTKMSQTAIQAMLPYMETIYGNPSSLHSVGQEAKEALNDARERVAKVLGATAREIYFTSGGSEADNQAIRSAAVLGKRKGKTHIISTAFEHHAVLHTLKKLEKEGFTVTYLDVHANGLVTPEQVALPGHHHVCQQRDRHHPANPGDRRCLPQGRRSVPHRRGPGCGPSAHQRGGGQHRHAVSVRP